MGGAARQDQRHAPLRRLSRSFDVPDAGAVKRCGCGNDYCKRDDVGEGHPEKRIGSDTSERVECLAGCFQQCLSATVDVYIFCFLRGLPKKNK
jgi:hypothetical protein